MPNDVYLVWSNEHTAWWGPGLNGYTRELAKAGRYSLAAALAICTNAMPGTAARLGMLPELPVRLAHVEAMQTEHHARLPNGPAESWE